MIKLLIIGLLLQIPVPTFPPLESPTPIPSSTPMPEQSGIELPTENLIQYLSTAEYNLSQAPADLRKSNGAILPGTTGSDVFKYAKWLISPNTANEILGPFGPIIAHIAIAITIVIVLAVVYFLIYVAVLLVRFIV